MLSLQEPSPAASPEHEPSLPTSTMPSTASLNTPPLSPDLSPKDLEIVIAHYNEDLSWLSDFSSHTTIYSKGSPPPPSSLFHRSFTLSNIGRESHTYLTHIVQNYDHLPPLTLFLQGNIHDINHGTPAHTDLSLSEIISQASDFSDGRTMPIGRVHSFSDWEGLQYLPGWIERRGKTLKRTHRSPAQFWQEVLFDGEPHPETVRFVQGALFGVTRGAIQRRPKSFYENVLRYFEELDEVNPEEGHYMERFWYAIFSDDAVEQKRRMVNGEDKGGSVDGVQ